MHARDLETAEESVAEARRRFVQALVLVLATAAASAGFFFVARTASIALAAGAGAEVLVAVHAAIRRHELVCRLAVEERAYVIPDVRRFGAAQCRLRERVRLARWILAVIAEAELSRPTTLQLVGRVTAHKEELAALAADLLSPAARFEPASAVACRRLFTHPVESPLYNPNLPDDDLGVVLRRIRRGVRRSPVGDPEHDLAEPVSIR